MIEVSKLSKSYGELRAVDSVSFTAREGRIFGLLGPNGAGKSTSIGCVSGLLRPTSGSVTILGHDSIRDGRKAREKLGVVPQEIALYEELSARENLVFWGSAYGLRGVRLTERIDAVLDLVQLVDRAKEPCKKFSGGMKRRLNFACGIIHEPQVLLLDEPTVGVDPQSRVRLLELVREQCKAGVCVLYTTHYMEEAESLCDELAILDHGRIIASGTLTELRAMVGERDVLRLQGSFDEAKARAALGDQEGLEIIEASADTMLMSVEQASRRLPEIFARLSSASCQIRETTMTQASLESLFIKLTGKELRE